MADALDSGSSECKFMRVQVPSSAPKNKSTVFRCFCFLDIMKDLKLWFRILRQSHKNSGEQSGALFDSWEENPFICTKKRA